MFITVHAATAVIIGKQVNSSIVGFLLGVASHFILDMIPHGDEQLGTTFFGNKIKLLKERGELKLMAMYGSIDSIFLAFLLLFLFKNFEFVNKDAVIWTIIGALIPDANAALYKLTEWKIFKGFQKIHTTIHSLIVKKFKADMPLKYGVAMQVCFLAILIWIISII